MANKMFRSRGSKAHNVMRHILVAFAPGIRTPKYMFGAALTM